MDKCLRCRNIASFRGQYVYCDYHIKAVYKKLSELNNTKCKNPRNICYAYKNCQVLEKYRNFDFLQSDDVTFTVTLEGKVYLHNYCAPCKSAMDLLRDDISDNKLKQNDLRNLIDLRQRTIDKLNDEINLYKSELEELVVLHKHKSDKVFKLHSEVTIAKKRKNEFPDDKPPKVSRIEEYDPERPT